MAVAYSNLGSALMIQTRHEEAFEAYCKAIALDPGNDATWSSYLFALNYRDDLAPAEVVKAHRDWGARKAGVAPLAAAPRSSKAGERLVIGYVSPDFRDHPVGLLVEPIVAAHDRSRFDVRCYSHGASADATTARIRAAADGWVETGDLDDAATAAHIHADHVDILVDLFGHTAGNRLGVFAHKPAPMQVSYAGYVTTTGLDAMDFVVHDRVTRFPEAEAGYAEHVLALDTCLYCYRPPDGAPPVAAPPVAANGHITFGSFNNTPKLTAATFDLWAAVLRRVPTSRFVLKTGAMRDAGTCERITAELKRRGAAPERLVLVPPTPFAAHLADYARIDIALSLPPTPRAWRTCAKPCANASPPRRSSTAPRSRSTSSGCCWRRGTAAQIQENFFKHAPPHQMGDDDQGSLLMNEAFKRFATRLMKRAFREPEPRISSITVMIAGGKIDGEASFFYVHGETGAMVKVTFTETDNVFVLHQVSKLDDKGVFSDLEAELLNPILNAYQASPLQP